MMGMEAPENKIIDKIRKLLALGENNPNENEAQAAILKAHALMAEHGIEAVAEDGEPSYAKEFCAHDGKRGFRKSLAAIIARNFRCRYYLVGGQIVFFGHHNDAKIAKEVFEYAYSFAYKESNRLYAQFRKEGKKTVGVINSYAYGFIKGLRDKLGEQSAALMVIVPPDVLEIYIQFTDGWPKSKSKVPDKSSIDGEVFNLGFEDGRTLMDKRRLSNGEGSA